MTIDVDQLAEALAARLRFPSPAGVPERHLMKGVCKHGRFWRVDTSIRGERIRKSGFRSRESALAWLAAKRGGAPLPPPEPVTTVDAVISFYLEHHRCKTQDRQHQLAAHVRRHLGERDAQALRQAHADDYATAREAEGAAAKTAWNELAMLRTALRYAWRNDLVPEGPRFTLSKPQCARRRVAWADEAARLVEAAELPLKRVVVAALSRGMRRGEIIDARWEQLHGDVLLIPTTKNGLPKEVPLSATLVDLLEQAPRHPTWLFAGARRGRRGKEVAIKWTKTTLRRRWDSLCERCGVQGLTFHDLRRSMASTALSLGHAPAAVQAAGGWADQVAMLRHYSHATSPAARAVGEDLERRLLGPQLRVVK